MNAIPLGFRVEGVRGGPRYYSVEGYRKSLHAGFGMGDVCELYPEPQPGCSPDVEVYHGWCWVQPRYVSAIRDMTGFTPLYCGPLLQRAPIDEDLLHIFPSIVENRLREKRPELYASGA
jgi:hypothetical protein